MCAAHYSLTTARPRDAVSPKTADPSRACLVRMPSEECANARSLNRYFCASSRKISLPSFCASPKNRW